MNDEIMSNDKIVDVDEDFHEESSPDNQGEPMEYNLTSFPRDYNPFLIKEYFDDGTFEIPLFQRNYVWPIEKASKLIESMILGLPVPEIFLFMTGDEEERYKIIDGQQRLLSVYFFMIGKFPKKDTRISIKDSINSKIEGFLDSKNSIPFKLKLEGSIYNDCTVNDLDEKNPNMKSKFEKRRFLNAVIIRQLEQNDQAMYEIFNRLNTGGDKLEPQEIRASLYPSEFLNMITELSDNSTWKRFYGNDNGILHGRDKEYIMRSLALVDDFINYNSKMLVFLNCYAKKVQNYTKDESEYFKEFFISFLDICKNFENTVFRRGDKGRQLSITVFESVFYAVSISSFDRKERKHLNIDFEQDTIMELIIKLKGNEEFTKITNSSSSSKNSVARRLQIAQDLLNNLRGQ
jgi:uncharacterized protein with ParB-like and HNH nuclease domain